MSQGRKAKPTPTQSSKPNIVYYAAGIIIIILLYLYITKPVQNTVIVTSSTSTIATSTTPTTFQPLVETLYNNRTIIVPGYSNNTVFYNYTYGFYNNYTISGEYNLTFYAPYDGYLVLYINKTNAPVGTYGISSNSNESDNVWCYNCITYNYTNGQPVRGLAGFGLTPEVNVTFFHVFPLLRGQQTFSFQNDNKYPISITFSLTYVGDKYPTPPPVTINYSVDAEQTNQESFSSAN